MTLVFHYASMCLKMQILTKSNRFGVLRNALAQHVWLRVVVGNIF